MHVYMHARVCAHVYEYACAQNTGGAEDNLGC